MKSRDMPMFPTKLRVPQVGNMVVYISPSNVEFYSLVIDVSVCLGKDKFERTINIPYLNLIIVNPNPEFVDRCGRKVEYVLNVVHIIARCNNNSCWRWLDETQYYFV